MLRGNGKESPTQKTSNKKKIDTYQNKNRVRKTLLSLTRTVFADFSLPRA